VRAHELSRQARTLEGIEGARDLAERKAAEAKELRDQARELQEKARLEDLRVRQESKVKRTKTGEKAYPYWVCSWREGSKVVTKYLGSCSKVSEDVALENARRMKADALGKSS
jgi:hypothetical protein